MRTIKEYPLLPSEEEAERMQKELKDPKNISYSLTLQLPSGAVIRRVNAKIVQREATVINPSTKAMEKGIISEEQHWMWAEVEDTNPLMARTFCVIPAEYEIPPFAVYVGTFLMMGGQIVLHVYERDLFKEDQHKK